MSVKKIRVLIDIDAATQSNPSGIGVYSRELLGAVAGLDPDNIIVIAHFFNFLGKSELSLPNEPNITYKQSRLLPRKIYNLLRRNGLNIPHELLTRTRVDFAIFPNFISKPSLFKTPYAVVLHDLTYADHPEYVSEKNRKDLASLVPKSLRSANFAVAISQTTKAAVAAHYPWFNRPIVVELMSASSDLQLSPPDPGNTLVKLGIQKQFVLFIGNLEPRKNIAGLVKAYEALPDDIRKKYALVLAGGAGWNNGEIRRAIESSRSQGNEIIETGYISNQVRSLLYSKASLLVFPSFYEGYGLPLLEAMFYSLPIVASNLPVIHEVAGGAALYCDPHNIADIVDKIRQGLTDDKIRSNLVEAGREISSGRSWHKVAESIINEAKKNI